MFWSKKDRDDYRDVMVDTLVGFFSEKQGVDV